MDFEPGGRAKAAEALATEVAKRLGDMPRPPGPSEVRRMATELGASGLPGAEGTVSAVLSVTRLVRGGPELAEVLSTMWLVAGALARLGRPSDEVAGGALVPCCVLAPRGAPIPPAPLAPVADLALVATEEVVAAVALPSPAVDVGAGAPGVGGLPGARPVPELAALPADAALLAGDAARAFTRRLIDVRRLLAAATALGIAEVALAAAVTALRGQGGRPRQAAEFRISDMATEVAAARAALLQGAWTLDEGRACSLECAAAKLLAARTATRVVHGALGAPLDSREVERLRGLYLDARLLEASDGAEAELEDTMASEMLGES